jgi:hypothetical protein
MNINVFKRLACIATVSVVSFSTYGQDLEDFLKEGYIKDSEKVIGAYISPLMKSASVGLNQGWYNTAKTHKIVGFDLTISVSALSIPTSETSFNPGKLGLKNIELDASSPGYPKAPTIFGKDQSPIFRDKNSGDLFEGASGIGLKDEIGRNIVPMPIANLGIGLPKGTDLKIRFVPEVDLNGEGSFKLFGLGVMHDIKQWIPGIKLLPFDLAGFVGYTRMTLTLDHEQETMPDANAHSDLTMSATTVQGVISKKFSVITFYGGLGYNISKSKIAVKGTYDVDEDGTGDVVNPVNLKFGASGPRMTAGFRLKLAILTLHADYTLQKYSAFTAGIGFAVR